MVRALVCGSFKVKRKIDPSGDQRRSLEVPEVLQRSRDSPPSLFARKISFPFEYARPFPSGDHAPLWPSRAPNRRGEPPTTGTLHSGPSREVPRAVFIRSEEPSGETSKT